MQQTVRPSHAGSTRNTMHKRAIVPMITDIGRKPTGKSSLSLLLCLVLFVCHAFSSFAAEYFVDFENGDNTNDGRSVNKPWKHSPGAANATGNPQATILQPNDVVYLKRGVIHDDTITINGSGIVVAQATNAVIDSTGMTLSSPTADFIAKGVTTDDQIFINGEGLFGIASVDSGTQITLSNPTLHTSLTDVEFLIGRYVWIKTTDWGEGPAVIRGMVRINRKHCVAIDGVAPNGIEITEDLFGIYATGHASDLQTGLIYRNLKIHRAGVHGGVGAGIYVSNSRFGLIERCEVSHNGRDDDTLGDDGILITSSSAYFTIQHCNIHNNYDDGIQGAPMHRSYIQNNEIHGHTAPTVHADGIQFNASSRFEVTVRYNRVYDNGSPTQWAAATIYCYYNLFYNTSPGSETGGNVGVRYTYGAQVHIWNNIFAFNSVAAIYGYSSAMEVDIQNNIFWENKCGGGVTPEIYVTNPTDSTASHNIYVREYFPANGDKIVDWGGSSHTLTEYQSIGQGHGSIYNEAGRYWVSEDRADFDLRPASSNSPQVASGVNLGLQRDFFGNPVPQTGPVSIGAVQYPFTDTEATPAPAPLVGFTADP